MNTNEISLIILCMGVFGWILIWFFFNGIVKIIRAFKGLDDDGYDRNLKNLKTTHKKCDEEEQTD